MFGEQSIYGQSTVRLDDKKRIILPRFTFAEAGDNLLVVNEGEYFSIYKEKILEEQIERKELEFEMANSRQKKVMKKELLILYSSILKKVVCDKERRITLGDIIDGDEIQCIGAKNHVILKVKNEEMKK